MIPAVVAHLWQATLFAAVAWLLVRAFRNHRAQVRYWIWFAASAKFLVPFSLLVAIGTLLPYRPAAPPIRTEWAAALQQLTQPLAPPPAQGSHTAAAPNHANLPAAALVLWACGFAAIAICWLRRWRRVQALRKSATVVRLSTALPIPLPVMSTPDLIEPGILGVFHPVLLLPESLPGRLNPSQLDAILAHELCHFRRRDNLTAAIHMAAQAIFWFHPLTWMVCRLYLSSPLACVSGVTGANLKRRIETIMRNRRAAPLNPWKKLVLAAAGAASLALPIIVGSLNAPAARAQDAAGWQAKAGGKMAFEVASVKLRQGPFVPPAFSLSAGDDYRQTGGHFRANFPVLTHIQFAYKLWPNEEQSREFSHLPKWVSADRYSIEARAPGNPSKDQMRLMVQSLLAERAKLAVHFETREVPVLALTLVQSGKLGPKLIPHAEGPPCDQPGAVPARGLIGFPPGCGALSALRLPDAGLMLVGYRGATMDVLAKSLSSLDLGRPVIDKTGLSGSFDYTLEFAPTKGKLQILVIDHLERPLEN